MVRNTYFVGSEVLLSAFYYCPSNGSFYGGFMTTHLRLFIAGLVLLVILFGTALVSTPASAHTMQQTYSCSGDGCTGLYPDASNCSALAYRIASAGYNIYYGKTSIMYSPNCRATYTQTDANANIWLLAKAQRVGTASYTSSGYGYTLKSQMTGYNSSHVYAWGCVHDTSHCVSFSY